MKEGIEGCVRVKEGGGGFLLKDGKQPRGLVIISFEGGLSRNKNKSGKLIMASEEKKGEKLPTVFQEK